MTVSSEAHGAGVCRRTAVCGLAVGGLAVPLLAACGDSADASDSAGGAAADAAAAKGTLAETDVPVGGGKILDAEKVVVTQPTAGDFKAFSSICTHQGCPVTSIEGAEIVCPCHNSRFSITDGSVISGPAQSPLEAKVVTAQGGQLTLG